MYLCTKFDLTINHAGGVHKQADRDCVYYSEDPTKFFVCTIWKIMG